MTLHYGSVFSGIGGTDLGFDRAGWQLAFQCEIDSYATRVLERHWPSTTRFTDVQEVSAHELTRSGVGPIDLLAGGFPCQDVSLAGRRAGLAGGRSGLFYEFARLAEELTPEWLLIENVPGLLSSGKRRDMGAVLGTLVELGYCVAWRVLDSQYFGLAQRRKRLFLVGHLGASGAPPLEVLLERQGGPGDSPPSREARTSVAAGARGGAYGDGVIAPALTSKMAKGTGGPSGDEHQNLVLEAPDVASTLTGGGNPNSNEAGRRGEDDVNLVAWQSYAKSHRAKSKDDHEIWREDELAPTLNLHEIGDVRASVLAVGIPLTHDVAGTLESQTEGAGARQEPGEHLVGYLGVREFSPDGAADAITSGIGFGPDVKHAQGHHLVEHYSVHNGDNACVAEDVSFSVTGSKGNPGAITDIGMVRKLTPLECERLQGFPDHWTEGLSDTRRYKTLGNAVSVPVAHWIATRIAAVANSKETTTP